MRSFSQHIIYTPSAGLNSFLTNYIDSETGKGLDYEFSSALNEYVIYFHFDDAFAYTSDLLSFYSDIKNIINTFRKDKTGNPTDYTELYFETENPKGDLDYDYFEHDGVFWQNTKFAQIVGYINSGTVLKTRPEIFSGSLESSFINKVNELNL